MAHAVHTTEALVLSSAGVQDADKLFWLFTEDLGLLFASARSVREEKSKLRFALQDLSLTNVSLVRGRGLWRITGAQECGAPRLEHATAQVFGRVAVLARRLIPTDEENVDLFTILCNTRSALVENVDSVEVIESVAVARMLYRLGYLTCKDEYRGIVDTVHFDEAIFKKGMKVVRKLIHDINSGLTESQL